MTSTRFPATPGRFLARLLLLLGAAALTVLGTTTPASAAGQPSSGGWVRLAHLSPDTPSVNVALTSFADSKSMLKLSDVDYGDVSAYQKVPAGRYVATMTPPGGGAASTPAVSQAVTVQDGHAYTVAAIGTNADLRGTVLDDDLRTPKAGSAKVRLIQAASSAPTATVTAVGGPVLAKDAAFGSATGYATIKQGVWTVEVAPTGGQPAQAEVTARSGSVNTIVLLDGPGDTVRTKVIRDASAAATQPKKGTGVETGGGGTATDVIAAPSAGRTALLPVLGLLAAAGAVLGGRSLRAARLRATAPVERR